MKFSSAKRFFIIKTGSGTTQVQGESCYNSDISALFCIFNKGKEVDYNFALDIMPMRVPVNPKKLIDVKNLLETYFGNEWHSKIELFFYKSLLNDVSVQEEDITESNFCEGNNGENLNLIQL